MSHINNGDSAVIDLDALGPATDIDGNEYAPFKPATDWARLAVLQTEREHIGRQLVRAGNHAHTTPTPDVKRYATLNNLIREALGL